MEDTINIKEEYLKFITAESLEDREKLLADFARRCCEMQKNADANLCYDTDSMKKIVEVPIVTIIS